MRPSKRAKFKAAQVPGLLRHDSREEVEHHSNENIDESRSCFNYDLVQSELTPLERYHNRMKEVFCLNRKDVNTMGSIMITLPEEVKEEDKDKFFELAFEYFKAFVGEENIICANVHLDEKTPHMHFQFIPVVEQQKTTRKGEVYMRESVSFKEKVPRSVFQKLHPKFQTWIDNQLGYHVGILNGKKLPVKSVNDIKRINQIEKDLTVKEEELTFLNSKLEKQRVEVAEVQDKLSVLNETKDVALKWTYEKDNSRYKETTKDDTYINTTEDYKEHEIDHKKSLFAEPTKYIEKDFVGERLEQAREYVNKTYADNISLKNEVEHLKTQNKSLEAQNERFKAFKDLGTSEDLKKQINVLNRKLEGVMQERDELKETLEERESTIAWYETFYNNFLEFFKGFKIQGKGVIETFVAERFKGQNNFEPIILKNLDEVLKQTKHYQQSR